MPRITRDVNLRFANAITVNNTTTTSSAILIGKRTNLRAIFEATAATASQTFTMAVSCCATSGGSYKNIAKMSANGLAGGAELDLVCDFTAYQPYVKVAITAPVAGTIVGSGYIVETSVNVLATQTFEGNRIY